MNPKRKRSVFISYSWFDADFARRLTDRLAESGLQPLVDRELPAGESWAESLAQAIDDSDFVIVLMSPDYFEGRWTQAELAHALGAEKKVIPILVRPCEVTGPLKYYNSLDLTADSGYAATEKVVELVAGLK